MPLALTVGLFIKSKYSTYLGNLFNSLQGHVCQHVGLNTAQEDVILHLVYLLLLLVATK